MMSPLNGCHPRCWETLSRQLRSRLCAAPPLRLSSEKHRIAGGPSGWNAHQGFYVYRNRRLLLPGDWLGLGFQKEEHYKLARIQVDLPNSFDHEWDMMSESPEPSRHHIFRTGCAA